jgi:hypothetical protein
MCFVLPVAYTPATRHHQPFQHDLHPCNQMQRLPYNCLTLQERAQEDTVAAILTAAAAAACFAGALLKQMPCSRSPSPTHNQICNVTVIQASSCNYTLHKPHSIHDSGCDHKSSRPANTSSRFCADAPGAAWHVR